MPPGQGGEGPSKCAAAALGNLSLLEKGMGGGVTERVGIRVGAKAGAGVAVGLVLRAASVLFRFSARNFAS